jgi:hypothetical protein
LTVSAIFCRIDLSLPMLVLLMARLREPVVPG